MIEAEQLVARTRSGAHDVLAEHAGGARDEQPHGIEMSELSPTMKR